MELSAPSPCLIATIAPRVEVWAEIDLQPAVAEVLDADLEVKRKLVEVETEAVRLHQIPVVITRVGRRQNKRRRQARRVERRGRKTTQLPRDKQASAGLGS